jgi:hypothetical protein
LSLHEKTNLVFLFNIIALNMFLSVVPGGENLPQPNISHSTVLAAQIGVAGMLTSAPHPNAFRVEQIIVLSMYHGPETAGLFMAPISHSFP